MRVSLVETGLRYTNGFRYLDPNLGCGNRGWLLVESIVPGKEIKDGRQGKSSIDGGRRDQLGVIVFVLGTPRGDGTGRGKKKSRKYY